MVEENPQADPNGRRRPGWLARLLGGLVAAVVIFRGATGPPARDGGEPPGPPDRPEEGNHHPTGGLEHASVSYEHSDANFRWIIGLILGAMVFAAVVHYVILRFYYDYAGYEANIKRSQYPLATDNGRLPREPRLEQVNRLANIEKGNVYLREEVKEEVLHSYGSLPGEEGYVRVPIERAMDFLAEGNRLPARRQAERGKKQNGLVDGGQPNSGHLLREEAPWYEP